MHDAAVEQSPLLSRVIGRSFRSQPYNVIYKCTSSSTTFNIVLLDIGLKRAPATRTLYLDPLVDSFGIFVHTHQLGDLIGFNFHLITPGDLFGRFYSQKTHLDLLLSRWEIYLDFTGTILRFPDPSLHG